MASVLITNRTGHSLLMIGVFRAGEERRYMLDRDRRERLGLKSNSATANAMPDLPYDVY